MIRFSHAMLPILLLPAAVLAQTGKLNDTGQTLCDNGSNVMVACSAVNSGDAATRPRQDGRFGRDPAAAAGQLSKTGAGAAGFDFTKVCMSGRLNCPGTASTEAAPTFFAWACTKDNNTNLIWSLQTQSDTWANATGALPTAANTANRCGFNSGWRLPTRRELLSIVHTGTSSPTIDAAYFPNTATSDYWSADTQASNPANAWAVSFSSVGGTNAISKAASRQVRLVRSGA